MQKSGAKAYLVNTGWNGTGKRISIKDTRGIIDAILSGAINEAPPRRSPTSTSRFPPCCPAWIPPSWIPATPMLMLPSGRARQGSGQPLHQELRKYEGNEHGKALVSAGPQL